MQCLQTARYDAHKIRVVNAVQTMNALLLGVYKCKDPSNTYADMSQFLLSEEVLHEFMEVIIIFMFI